MTSFNVTPSLGMTTELLVYYGKKFGGKVDIRPPGSAGAYDPLEQFGNIRFEKEGIKRKVVFSDGWWMEGFDGLDDLVVTASENWHNMDHEMWKGPMNETRVDFNYNPLVYQLDSFNSEMQVAIKGWQKYFGLI
jgi:hypothetical protein